MQSALRTDGPANRRRVLIVDDHPIVRHGLRRMIEAEPDLTVCGDVESAAEARRAIRELEPDVAIVDLSLEHGDGLELVRDAHAQYPKLPILVLSMHDETIYGERLLAVGAMGYIMKQAASEQLLVALRRVLAGEKYLSEALLRRAADGGESPSSAERSDPVGRLSIREIQVLHLIGRGMSSRQVAQDLRLSVKTVESHRLTIKRKLNLSTNSQLLQYAMNWFSGSKG